MNTNDTGREPTDAEPRNCHDCGAMPGQYHMDGCDVERCPECGGQRISCDCDLPGPHRALPWTGEWPGKAEAREFGWFSRFVDGHGWVRCDKNEAGASPDLNRLVAEAVWDADAGRFVLSGARPMPDLIHEDELPEMTNAEYAAWYEKSFIPGGVGCRVGPRHMPDTPAPSTDDPVCGATTRVDGKFRTCELPNGHTSDHRTTLRGIEIWWPVDEPNAPDEVAQLRAEVARLRQGLWDCFAAAGGDTDGDATPAAVVSDLVSLTLDTVQGTRKDDEDEINRLTARIDDLERDNAALRAELADAAEHLCYINRIDTKRPTPDHNRVVDRIRAMATTGKEPTDA